MAADYRRMAVVRGEYKSEDTRCRRAEASYDESVMPSQKAAISNNVRTSRTRKRFLRTAKMMTAMVQSRNPSSGQKNPEPNPSPLELAAPSSQKEANEVAAVSIATTAPASAMPFAHSGSIQSFRASRQSSHVCATTIPTITKTNSATVPLPSANRSASRAFALCRPMRRSVKALSLAWNSSRAAAVESPSVPPHMPYAALLRQTLLLRLPSQQLHLTELMSQCDEKSHRHSSPKECCIHSDT
jgi:hypothetical protein